MSITQWIRVWWLTRALSKAERLDYIHHLGYALGFDEGFLEALNEPDDDVEHYLK